MIAVPAGVRVLIATKPVDFRRAPTALPHLRARSFNAIRSRGRFSFSARKERIV